MGWYPSRRSDESLLESTGMSFRMAPITRLADPISTLVSQSRPLRCSVLANVRRSSTMITWNAAVAPATAEKI